MNPVSATDSAAIAPSANRSTTPPCWSSARGGRGRSRCSRACCGGAPEIAIVIDRRARDRRGEPGREADHGRPVGYVVERRETDRRRAPSLYLV
jgi:hypothetical protein